MLHDAVDLANELHVPVLDPAVDHLDLVPGPEAAKVAGAWAARALLRVGGENRIGRLE